MNFTICDPTRTESGALATLVRKLGEEEAQPILLTDPQSALSNFRVLSDYISVSAGATLGVGSIFTGAIDGKEQGFYYDAMTYTDQYREQQQPDSSIQATRWGVGIRVLLRVSDISTDVELNFGIVGAAVELQQARARYEIIGIGIGQAGLNIVLDELSGLGSFTFDTYTKLNGGVIKRLSEYMDANASSLRPQAVAVALAKPVDPLGEAQSIYYAMWYISRGWTLQRVVTQAPLTIDRDIIRNVYVEVATIQDDSETPSYAAQQRAREWLG